MSNKQYFTHFFNIADKSLQLVTLTRFTISALTMSIDIEPLNPLTDKQHFNVPQNLTSLQFWCTLHI